MNRSVFKAIVVGAVLTPVIGVATLVSFAQKMKPTTATYITKEEIDMVGKAEQDKSTQDMNVKVVDLGYENFSLGIIHRGTTRKPPTPGGGGGNANANAPAPEPCGRHMDAMPAGGTPGGLTHDFQTEGYLIISGSGTMMTDGYIVNGRHTDIQMNGWSCGGTAFAVKKVDVKVGDVVVVPPGVVHGWADIADHVDYMSFRPSQSALEAGYVNPIIANIKP
jgi:mannose-6-phosphate isomerase-like protein (cupin superfamily)